MLQAKSSSGYIEFDKRFHLHPLTNPVELRGKGLEMVTRAEGVYLHLGARKVMDINSGLANVTLGYGNKRLCEAAFKAMTNLSYCHSIFGRSNPYVAALSAKLADITPKQFQTFFFASSGSEANESAIKLALHYWRLKGKPEKRLTLARRDSYHGSTLFTSNLTGQPFFHAQFGLPFADMVHHADSTNWYQEGSGRSREVYFRDLIGSLEKQILEIGPERIAAFIGEAVQTGLFIPEPYYWQGMRELCDRYEILLISDEVVTGFGKSGRMFGFEHFGFEPDLFSMAKSMTSGYFPLSAVGIGEKVAEVVQRDSALFAHVFTNSGHPVGAAVALETLAIIEEQKLVERAENEVGKRLAEHLNRLLEFPCVKDIRSLGVMGAFDVDASKGAGTASKEENDALREKIAQIAFRRGAVMRGTGMCLPMTITNEEINEGMRIVMESVAEAMHLA